MFLNKAISALVICGALGFGASVNAQNSGGLPGIQKEIAKLGKSDIAIKEFYEARGYTPLWVGGKNRTRRTALLNALKSSAAHGLPAAKYQGRELQALFNAARGLNNRGPAEVTATRLYLMYANDVSSGLVRPSSVDEEIAVTRPRRNPINLLNAIATSKNPAKTLAGLAPRHPHYAVLMKEKAILERALGRGGFGKAVPKATLNPGTSSPNVTVMRKRLASMGYPVKGNSAAYDANLVNVVKAFQSDSGLSADGVVGAGTLAALNQSAEDRLKSVLVNLERQRWLNINRGDRHIVVNIPDFSVGVYDGGKQSFYSRTVVGEVKDKKRTVEFYDEMTHMVINPTWNVPKSIAVKEYVPIMQRDPGFLKKRGMFIVNGSGKPVNPSREELAKYNEDNYKTFPYFIKQKPDPRNALGLVKFMFPNKYNIYLHDTPSKSLFNKQVRAFSHGCVRVHKPFDFAYTLLSKQLNNPKGFFKSKLDTGKETYVNLKQAVPVYITYSTAFVNTASRVSYRRDVYGRDKSVFRALSKAGVQIRAVNG